MTKVKQLATHCVSLESDFIEGIHIYLLFCSTCFKQAIFVAQMYNRCYPCVCVGELPLSSTSFLQLLPPFMRCKKAKNLDYTAAAS